MNQQARPPETLGDRIGLALFALILGLLGTWIYWAAHRFEQGPPGGLRWVYLIVDEFVYAIWLFAVLLLVRAIFAPAWLDRLLRFAYKHLRDVILLIGVLVFLSVLFVAITANLR